MTNELQNDEVPGSSQSENVIILEVPDINQHKIEIEEVLDTQEKEVVTVNTNYVTSLSKQLRHNTDLFNLDQFLQNSCTGRGIIKEYEKNSILSRKSRNSLVTLLVNHFLDESRYNLPFFNFTFKQFYVS